MTSTYLGSCVSRTASEIEQYNATEREADKVQVLARVGPENLRDVFPMYGWDDLDVLQMIDDPCIMYGYGYLNGNPVWCIHHSRIHHFFTRTHMSEDKCPVCGCVEMYPWSATQDYPSQIGLECGYEIMGEGCKNAERLAIERAAEIKRLRSELKAANDLLAAIAKAKGTT